MSDGPRAVAYLGPQGTFTHMAARSFFGSDAHYVECRSIADVVDAVTRGSAECGVAPIENSTEGGVTATLDSLFESQLFIVAEVVLQISQCLVGKTAELGRIRRVHSHPQALAQCQKWLATNLPHAELVVSSSTSAAVREASMDETAAAVASRLAAELHDARIIREDIQDRSDNATRFVVIAGEDGERTGRDKTSVVFSTPHERGALRRALEVFDEEGINLTRIESRPASGKMWEYVFFTDLEGHREDPSIARALDRLRGLCATVKVLGSYPRAN